MNIKKRKKREEGRKGRMRGRRCGGVWDKKEGRKMWYQAILSPFIFKIMLEAFPRTTDNQINKATHLTKSKK